MRSFIFTRKPTERMCDLCTNYATHWKDNTMICLGCLNHMALDEQVRGNSITYFKATYSAFDNLPEGLV